MKSLLLALLLAFAGVKLPAAQASPLDFFYGYTRALTPDTLQPHKRSAPTPCSAAELEICLNHADCLKEDDQAFCLCPPSFFGTTCQLQAYTATLSGANEVPPNDSPFTGSAQAIYDTVARGITLSGTSNVVNVTASHIHRGDAASTGAVIVPIQFNGDVMVGITTPYVFTIADAGLLVNRSTYVNVHNTQKPPGIIRGQLIPFDACNSKDCGMGVCVSQGFSSFCHCLEGFSGETCQIPPDPCSPNPCLHTGECVNSDSHPLCNCPPGFTGDFCQFTPPSCPVNKCFNGGECYAFPHDGLEIVCTCPASSFGPLCEMTGGDAFCNLQPCQSSSHCNGDLYNFTPCDCQPDHFGVYCEATPCYDPVCFSNGQVQKIRPDPVPIASSIEYEGTQTPFTQLRIFTNISHISSGDLQITLLAPSGFSILTFSKPQGMVDAFKGTYWTDAAQYDPSNYPFLNGTGATELRPQMLPLAPLLHNITGTWTLVVLDAVLENDGVFFGWRLEFDHWDDCENVTCGEGEICIDGFNTFYCALDDGIPCVSGETCINGECAVTSAGVVCQCFAGFLGDFCATALCQSPFCTVTGVQVPISETLPPLKSSVFLSDLTPTLPPNTQIWLQVQLNHSYNDDLTLFLTSPQGTKITLATRNGGYHQNLYNGISFGSFGQKTLLEIPIFQDGPPDVSAVLPLDPFSLFLGEDPNGEWVLEVVDSQEHDSGVFFGWTIVFDYEDQCEESSCPEEMVCVDSFMGPSCACPPGSAGPGCLPVSPCNPNPCFAGNCLLSGIDGFTCDCFAYSGPLCDIQTCTTTDCTRGNLSPISESLSPFKSAIMVSRPGTSLTRLTVGLVLSHGSSRELTISLTSPKGTRILLSHSRGGVDTFFGVLFDQLAPVSIADYNSSFSETSFRPEQSLDAFVGEIPDGFWNLEVVDGVYGEDGVFFSWSLTFHDVPTKCNRIVIDNASFNEAALNTLTFGTCIPGFVGKPSRRCTSNGFFGPAINSCYSASLTCPPADYSNAHWPETFVTTTANGSCNYGYQGNPTRRCTVNGTWESNVASHCQRVVCLATTLDDVSFPGTNSLQRVAGTCLAGYGGKVYRECMGDGSFGPATGTCNLPCAPQENYGRATWPFTAPEAVASGTCIPGWMGAPSRKCNRDGSWQDNIANHCQRITCPTETIEGASYPSAQFEQTTTGGCPTGTIGNPRRQCQANGHFGPIISGACISLSSQCPQETFGNIPWPSSSVGSLALGSCPSGWAGTPKRLCALTGAWDSNIQGRCSRITCPASDDGVYAFNKIDAGTQAYGRCLVGTGHPWRKCDMNGVPGPIIGVCA